ncbi:hypothetical protein BaRGS_00004768 [Batillaria attramentaria]|uniref:Uncharacterized protein n=1 Tax=Batillaria attramentaria TaxID=370345 RepID=A0ABD0LXW2_9CAEN
MTAAKDNCAELSVLVTSYATSPETDIPRGGFNFRWHAVEVLLRVINLSRNTVHPWSDFSKCITLAIGLRQCTFSRTDAEVIMT